MVRKNGALLQKGTDLGGGHCGIGISAEANIGILEYRQKCGISPSQVMMFLGMTSVSISVSIWAYENSQYRNKGFL